MNFLKESIVGMMMARNIKNVIGHDRCTNQESTGHNNLHHAKHFLVALNASLDVGLTHAMLTIILSQLYQAFVKGGEHHIDGVDAQHHKA